MEEIQAILADPAKLHEVTKAVFDQVDEDGSGQIDKKEFKRAMEIVAAESSLPVPSDAQVNEALQTLDSDNSGTLSVNEFQVLVKALLEALVS